MNKLIWKTRYNNFESDFYFKLQKEVNEVLSKNSIIAKQSKFQSMELYRLKQTIDDSVIIQNKYNKIL